MYKIHTINEGRWCVKFNNLLMKVLLKMLISITNFGVRNW